MIFDKGGFDRVLAEVYVDHDPRYLIVSPVAASGIMAIIANEGRDRRRVKREYRKAVASTSKEARQRRLT